MSFRWRTVLLLMALLLRGNSGCAAGQQEASDLETSVCGFLREPLAFWFFRQAAGVADARRIAGIQAIERLAFRTRDGRTLGGYKLRSPAAQGYLLVAQGNAMLADQIVGALQFFRERGLDVYVYDYRGYGLSQGNSRLKAIIADYRDIIAALNAQGYPRHFLYGMSLGGIILLNAIAGNDDYQAVVIDSSPSRISLLGCPEYYDPVNTLPPDCSRIRFIAGERDHVVRLADMEELLRIAQHRGAQVLIQREFAHPFQDVSEEIHRRRFEAVANFLTR
jgi:alpha/beta superfamily hydrolase